MDGFTTFLQLQKVDVAKREVWGTAAVEQPDRAREIMDYEKSLPNFLNWSRDMVKASGGLSQGNVRAMHRDVAAGKVIHMEPRDDTKSIYIGAKIVDDNEWKKVLEGVYTGFSVGGSYGEKWPDPVLAGVTRYEAKPVEISLVDVPCMPGAQFEVVKADGSREMRKLATVDELGKGDFEGHPFRGNQYADVAGGHDDMQSAVEHAKKTANGNTLSIFKEKSTGKFHVLSNEQSARIDPFSDEYEYVSKINPPKVRKPDSPQHQGELPDRFVNVNAFKQSVGIADLIKGAGMKTNEVLDKLNASTDPAMQLLAVELKKAFPPAKEKKDEESESEPEADDKKQAKANPFDKSKEKDAAAEGETTEHEESETPEEEAQEEASGEESEEQTAGTPDPAKTEQVRAIVIQLLEELGFVQEQGGQPGAPMAMKFAAVSELQKRLTDREDTLQKAYDAVTARQTEITSDLVKLSTTVDEMEKRGGPAPILRDLGVLTPEIAGVMQKAAAIKDLISKTSDPIVKQALQSELTTLEIKQLKPIQ